MSDIEKDKTVEEKDTSKKKVVRKKKSKSKKEFMKIVVMLAFGLGFASVTCSYILAFLGYDTNSEVTSEIVRTLLATIVSYAMKSYAEKNSRNKYGVEVQEPVFTDEDNNAFEDFSTSEDFSSRDDTLNL